MTDRTEFDAVAVNVSEGLIACDDGAVLPITDWFDEDYEACEPECAVYAVAGPHPTAPKPWMLCTLSAFGGASVH